MINIAVQLTKTPKIFGVGLTNYSSILMKDFIKTKWETGLIQKYKNV